MMESLGLAAEMLRLRVQKKKRNQSGSAVSHAHLQSALLPSELILFLRQDHIILTLGHTLTYLKSSNLLFPQAVYVAGTKQEVLMVRCLRPEQSPRERQFLEVGLRNTKMFIYENGEFIKVGDRVLIAKKTMATIESLCLQHSKEAANWEAEETGCILLTLDGGVDQVWPWNGVDVDLELISRAFKSP